MNNNLNNQPRRLRAVSRGFTLVELMVVVAVIVILAVIALPAYKTYALKAKFTEVVVASLPTKTAISTCAGTGECIASGAINLAATGAAGGSGGSGSGSGGSGSGSGNGVTTTIPALPQMITTTTTVNGVTTTTTTPLQSTPAEIYSLIAGAFSSDGGLTTPDIGLFFANTYATDWANTQGWYLEPDPSIPGNACMTQVGAPVVGSGFGCQTYSVPLSTMNHFYNSTVNPYWSSRDDAMQAQSVLALPCVAGPNCTPSTKYVASVSYTTTGTVVATAASTGGLNGETFILVPLYNNGVVDWITSGSCKTRAGGAIC